MQLSQLIIPARKTHSRVYCKAQRCLDRDIYHHCRKSAIKSGKYPFTPIICLWPAANAVNGTETGQARSDTTQKPLPVCSIIPKPVAVPVLKNFSPINLPGKLCIPIFLHLQPHVARRLSGGKDFLPVYPTCLPEASVPGEGLHGGSCRATLMQHLGLLSGVHKGDVHTSKPCKQE